MERNLCILLNQANKATPDPISSFISDRQTKQSNEEQSPFTYSYPAIDQKPTKDINQT